MTVGKKRPRPVTITLLGVILLGVWSTAQALAMTQQIDLLLAINLKPDPRLLLVNYLLWTLLFLGSAVALKRRHAFTRWLIPLLICLYALLDFFLQVVYVSVPSTIQDWLLRILIFGAALLFAVWSLNSSAARAYLVRVRQAPLQGEKES